MSSDQQPFYAHEKADPAHIGRERRKAKELRESQWWKQKIGEGKCHYCENSYSKAELTMDHILPISRGGKTSKGNVVVACKACNNKKKWMTPAEMILSSHDNV
jgi:5-methylcytosine-specific restriction enzyme A